MRVSTLYMFKQSSEAMNKRMMESNEVSMRLSAGKSLLRASDDPQAATDAVKYQDALSKLELYSDVRSSARGTLELEDHTLSSAADLITTTLTEKIIAAKSETYSDADKKALSKELAGIRQNMMDLANTRDASGRYIFSGYNTDSSPFDATGNYVGGNETRKQTVAEGSEMEISHLGDEIFGDLFKKMDAAISELDSPTSPARLEMVLSEAHKEISSGISRIGNAQAELGTNLQQLDSLDLTGDNLINDAIIKVQNAIGNDYSEMTSLIMDSKMAEFALNASMMVFKSMQKMSLFTS